MDLLPSFRTPIHALVVGASGGLGSALTHCLLEAHGVESVTAWSRTALSMRHEKLVVGSVDILHEAQIIAAASAISQPLHLVIVATGLLHDAELQPEKSWRALDADAMQRSFAVNAIGPALIAKHTLPLLARREKAVFAAMTARIGSIGDNRRGGWYGYRSAKAALNQIIKTLSIELAAKRPEAICVGLHPGTVDTQLSRPFQSATQGAALFSPDLSASKLLAVIDGLVPSDTGTVHAWDGTVVPP